ncbi:MAG: multidrug effflux MFS transporter [Gammaproteobacteria bacterium]|nr:multidrug effflux MFS transporter [Gammaproteobacteria bacterium]
MSLGGGQSQPGFVEFIILIAFIVSLVALSIDAMLPALPDIAAELQFSNPNDSHFIISMLFVGMSFGQIIFGPLSDFTGRKPAIIWGILIFIVGSLISYFSNSMSDMMIGRFLQGLGAAGPRIVSVALMRDRYEGRQMARVMSFVMTVFILVPVFAPAVGQLILNFGGWRSIFGMFIVMSLMTLLWFTVRQPETLSATQRKQFSAIQMLIDIRHIVAIPAVTGYTLTMGFLFGAFLGYLSSAQQIFQVQYGLGNLFAAYFGVLAASIGVAALINAKLVMRYGMRRLSFIAMFVIALLSTLFLLLAQYFSGHPPLAIFMVYLLVIFFFFGILFGNLNALAMEPLGQIAGLGAALVGSVSTLISVVLGALVADAYDGTIIPLVIGIAVLSVASLISMRWTEGFG